MAQELVTCVYNLTRDFPVVERYGLSSQMRRAAVSVAANLAEGCGRMGDIELRRFLRIGLGSLSELECELIISSNLQFITTDLIDELSTKIGAIRGMLLRLHRTLPHQYPSVRTLDPRP
jgi:four helix bundle protein